MSGVRRIVLWVLSTITVLVLLFGYRTSTSSEPAGTTLAAPGRQGAGLSASAPTGTSASGQVVTGPAVDTRWGPVRVAITVSGGRVTAVDVPVYPQNNGRDLQINARALPILVRETLDAQSADIDMVSGATVTSEGYLSSLQAALDDAGI